MSEVDDITTQGIAALRAVVDAGEAKAAELRAQRDALKAQIEPLQAQLTALTVQIRELEGAETERARKAIRDITMLKTRAQAMRRGL